MNDIVEKNNGGALAAVAALKGNLQRTKAQLPTGRMAFLRFLQDGSWVFGQENEEVTEDDLVAINPMSIKTGWSCWTDRPGKGAKNENLDEVMVPLGNDPVLKTDLPTYHDEKNNGAVCQWKEQISVDVKFLNGPHKGKQVLYKTTSVGGTNAMSDLIDRIMLQLDEDPANPVPVIVLSGDHYSHPSYGRTYTPILDIDHWISMEGVAAGEDGEDAGDEDGPREEPATKAKDEKPAKRTRKSRAKAEPEPEPEPEVEPEVEDAEVEDEAPRRRRRRR